MSLLRKLLSYNIVWWCIFIFTISEWHYNLLEEKTSLVYNPSGWAVFITFIIAVLSQYLVSKRVNE